MTKLGPKQEAWLRDNIPVWGTMRDHAVAAGLIEPEAPELTTDQNIAIERIENTRKRVIAILNGAANSNKE